MRIALIILVFLLVIGGGVFGFLVYTGKINLSSKPRPVARVVPPGATLVPWNMRQLPADTMITRELLINPANGEIATFPVDLNQLQGRGVMISVSQVLGRVLRKDMRPGYVFTETDFYPKGTKSGITAEIPPGKRAVSLDASKISGARLLKRGDHVDLVASQAYDPSKRALAANPRLAILRSDPSMLVKQAKVVVLAQDGVVIIPVTARQVPVSEKGKLKSVEEISIAVDSTDVTGVMEAVGAGAEMFCTIHSGQPEDPRNDNRLLAPPPPVPIIPVPTQTPLPSIAKVETIVGRKHEFLALPSATVQTPQTQPAPSSLTSDARGVLRE